MSLQRFVRQLGLFILLLFALIRTGQAALADSKSEKVKPPNILWITCEDNGPRARLLR